MQYGATTTSDTELRYTAGLHRCCGGMAATPTQSPCRRSSLGRYPATAGAPRQHATLPYYIRRQRPTRRTILCARMGCPSRKTSGTAENWGVVVTSRPPGIDRMLLEHYVISGC